VEIAKQLLEDGMSYDLISKQTNLIIEEIKQLQDK